jgi:hypothetical protein
MDFSKDYASPFKFEYGILSQSVFIKCFWNFGT